MHETIIENWEKLKTGAIKSRVQQGKSTFHSRRKFEEFKEEIPFDWNENICEFLVRNEKKIQEFLNSYQ